MENVKQKLIIPSKLEQGDTIGVISPSGSVSYSQDDVSRSIHFFESIGLKVQCAPSLFKSHHYLAGTDEERLDDLHTFFADHAIKLIFASRGGYGTTRLLDKIDYSLIAKNPKIFCGYSDNTALLLSFYRHTGLMTIHGPHFIKDFISPNPYTAQQFLNMVTGKVFMPYTVLNRVKHETIIPGQARGPLVGGNLSVICSLLGTDYLPDLTGTILFLEDISEPAYRVDRMLNQLRLAGVFHQINGLILGYFTNFPHTPPTLNDLIKELTADLTIPIMSGFSVGHEEEKASLPIGVQVFLDSTTGLLQIEGKWFK